MNTIWFSERRGGRSYRGESKQCEGELRQTPLMVAFGETPKHLNKSFNIIYQLNSFVDSLITGVTHFLHCKHEHNTFQCTKGCVVLWKRSQAVVLAIRSNMKVQH